MLLCSCLLSPPPAMTETREPAETGGYASLEEDEENLSPGPEHSSDSEYTLSEPDSESEECSGPVGGRDAASALRQRPVPARPGQLGAGRVSRCPGTGWQGCRRSRRLRQASLQAPGQLERGDTEGAGAWAAKPARSRSRSGTWAAWKPGPARPAASQTRQRLYHHPWTQASGRLSGKGERGRRSVCGGRCLPPPQPPTL